MKFKYRNLLLALTLTGAMAFTGCTATNSAARAGARYNTNTVTERSANLQSGTSNAAGTQVAGRVDGVNIHRGSGPRRQSSASRNIDASRATRNTGNYNTDTRLGQDVRINNQAGNARLNRYGKTGMPGNVRPAGQQGQRQPATPGQGRSVSQTGAQQGSRVTRAKSIGVLPQATTGTTAESGTTKGTIKTTKTTANRATALKRQPGITKQIEPSKGSTIESTKKRRRKTDNQEFVKQIG
jgi:hypothetical protein